MKAEFFNDFWRAHAAVDKEGLPKGVKALDAGTGSSSRGAQPALPASRPEARVVRVLSNMVTAA
jgi:hypothetical protein